MADTQIKEGDQVSWQWSGSRPGGTVAEVATEGKVTIESHRGNMISKNAEPANPAVHIEREGNDVVKKASELAIENEGDKHKEAPGVEKTVTPAPQTGDKRPAEETAEAKKDEAAESKKAKTGGDKVPKANGEQQQPAPKKKGRPAKGDTTGPKKETKKRAPKKAATESGEPRRSGRVAAKSS